MRSLRQLALIKSYHCCRGIYSARLILIVKIEHLYLNFCDMTTSCEYLLGQSLRLWSWRGFKVHNLEFITFETAYFVQGFVVTVVY